jgi:hypothetical protein
VHREAGEEPVHLELVDVLELYAAIIGGTVTQAADQLRDRAGLESALGRPRSSAGTTPGQLAQLMRTRLRPVR